MAVVNWVSSEPLTHFKKYQLSSGPVWEWNFITWKELPFSEFWNSSWLGLNLDQDQDPSLAIFDNEIGPVLQLQHQHVHTSCRSILQNLYQKRAGILSNSLHCKYRYRLIQNKAKCQKGRTSVKSLLRHIKIKFNLFLSILTLFSSRDSTNFQSNTGNAGCRTDYVRIPNSNNIVGGDCTTPPGGAPISSPTIDRQVETME